MKNILFVSHRIPYPPSKGDKIRAFQMIQHLKALGHQVDCAFPVEDVTDFEYIQTLKKNCNGIIYPVKVASKLNKFYVIIKALFTGKSLTQALGMNLMLYKLLAKRQTEYDIVIFYSAVSYLYKDAIKAKKYVCDFVDVDSYKWKEYTKTSNILMKLIYYREYKYVQQLERKIAQDVDLSIFITDAEKQLFLNENQQIDFKNPITVIENTIDSDYWQSGTAHITPFLPQYNDHLIFVMTGAMDYKPNYDGAIFFIKHILPKLQKNTHRKIGFYCVGRNPVKKLKKYHNPSKNIVITGYVKDVRPYVVNGFASIAPLFIGRGLQNKVLEGMALGKTCFVSPNAYKGIDAIDNKHLVICNNIDEWCTKITHMINNPAQANMISHAASEHIHSRYSIKLMREKFNYILQSLDA